MTVAMSTCMVTGHRLTEDIGMDMGLYSGWVAAV